MPLAAGLQIGDDREHVVGRLREVEEQPLAGAVHMREGARHIDLPALVAMWKVAHHRPLLVRPETADAGIFRMKRLDGGGRAVDRDAHRPQSLDERRQQLVLVVDLHGARHQPVPQRNGLRQGLGAQASGDVDRVFGGSGGKRHKAKVGFTA